jgi:hypothetical protein
MTVKPGWETWPPRWLRRFRGTSPAEAEPPSAFSALVRVPSCRSAVTVRRPYSTTPPHNAPPNSSAYALASRCQSGDSVTATARSLRC